MTEGPWTCCVTHLEAEVGVHLVQAIQVDHLGDVADTCQHQATDVSRNPEETYSIRSMFPTHMLWTKARKVAHLERMMMVSGTYMSVAEILATKSNAISTGPFAHRMAYGLLPAAHNRAVEGDRMCVRAGLI